MELRIICKTRSGLQNFWNAEEVGLDYASPEETTYQHPMAGPRPGIRSGKERRPASQQPKDNGFAACHQWPTVRSSMSNGLK